MWLESLMTRGVLKVLSQSDMSETTLVVSSAFCFSKRGIATVGMIVVFHFSILHRVFFYIAQNLEIFFVCNE